MAVAVQRRGGAADRQTTESITIYAVLCVTDRGHAVLFRIRRNGNQQATPGIVGC